MNTATHWNRLAGSRTEPDPFWTDARVGTWTWAFVWFGVVLRLVRLALRHPIWGDEAFLASNLLDRDFSGLAQPLNYVQVCPLLFLWAEKAVMLVLGFSEFTLRLLPTLASIGALFLFRHVAARLMRGPAVLIAVAILAIGFYPIRHGGEIKPYSVDFLVALGLVALAIEWLRSPERTGYLWGLTVLGPVAVASSHPAIFVAAGVGMALLLPVWRQHRLSAMLALATYGIATLSVFGLLLQTVTTSQSDSVMGTMRDYWAGAFPPRGLAPLLKWLATVHTSHMFAYPAGGDSGASTLTTGLVFAGCLAFLRRGSRTILLLLIAPFAFGLVASFLGRYPYGGSARTMQYVAPAIILLAGLGAAVLLGRLPSPGAQARSVTYVTVLLGVVGIGLMGWDVTHPYKSVYDQSSRDYARRFWSEQARDAVLVCARTDLQLPLDPIGWRSDRSAIYLCHQDMFSSRIREKRTPELGAITSSHPLRVVVFAERPGDRIAVESWIDKFGTGAVDVTRAEYFVNKGVNSKMGHFEDRYVVYELKPKAEVAERVGTLTR